METLGEYGKVFDKNNVCWLGNMELNRYYLIARESQVNDMLKARGHLFLNMGCIVGWMYGPGVHVSFSIPNLEEIKDSIPLSFNVDGIIYDKIEEGP